MDVSRADLSSPLERQSQEMVTQQALKGDSLNLIAVQRKRTMSVGHEQERQLIRVTLVPASLIDSLCFTMRFTNKICFPAPSGPLPQ